MKDMKSIRKSRGLTQQELEQLTGVGIPRLSKFENGVLLPTMREAKAIESALGCKIKWPDPLPEDEKARLIDQIQELSERYPLSIVMRHVNRKVQEETRNHQTVTP